MAIKFLRRDPHAGTDEVRELDVMKNVGHPHLLVLHRYWRRGGWLIVALELAQRTLLDRLREVNQQGQAGVPLEELLEYVREAAKGLDYLHGKGIQHRDVKPANLLLVGGSVKVADFGLVKLLESTVATNTNLNIAGTPAFAAPEVWQRKTSAHSDQYALAVSYCQLRGGKLPFQGDLMAVVFAHCNGDADLSMVPTEAERSVVKRALATDPKQRFPTCKAFADALAAAAGMAPGSASPQSQWPTLPQQPPPGPSRPSRRRFGVLAAVALASLGTLAAAGVWLTTRESDPTRTGALASASRQQPPKGEELAKETERKDDRQKVRDVRKEKGKNGGESLASKPGPATPQTAKAGPPPGKADGPGAEPAKRQAAGPDAPPAKPQPPGPGPANTDPGLVNSRPPAPAPEKSPQAPPESKPPKRPPAPAALRLLLPPLEKPVLVLEGSPAPLDVKVRRENFTGPVTLSLTGLPAGVRVSPDEIPAGSNELRLYLTADNTAAPAVRDITLTASGANKSDRARFQLVVNQVTNSIDMRLVRVPAGTFRMGSPDDDSFAKADEKPQHTVAVSAFYLSRYEVTRRQYRQFAEKMRHTPPAKRSGPGGYTADKKGYEDTGTELTWQEPDIVQTDEHPVVCVSWNEAVEFCNWLSNKEDLQPCYTRVAGGRDWKCEFAANGYRLPTEAEWEYACRAGATSRYSNGDDPEKLAQVGKVSFRSGEQQSTSPVGRFRANAFGLYDMHGNAREWCWDRYAKYGAGAGVETDPHGPDSGSARVLRGGSWRQGPKDCRCAARDKYTADNPGNSVGFRVARSRAD